MKFNNNFGRRQCIRVVLLGLSLSLLFVTNAQQTTAEEENENELFQNCVTSTLQVDTNANLRLDRDEFDTLIQDNLNGCLSDLVELIFWNFACPDTVDDECDPSSAAVPLDSSTRFTFCAVASTAVSESCVNTQPPNSTPDITPAPTTPTTAPVPPDVGDDENFVTQSNIVAFRIQFFENSQTDTENTDANNDAIDDVDGIIYEILNESFQFLAKESFTSIPEKLEPTNINTTIEEWIPPTTCITTSVAPDENIVDESMVTGSNAIQPDNSELHCATGRWMIHFRLEEISENEMLTDEELEAFQTTLLDLASDDVFRARLEQWLMDFGYGLQFVQFIPIMPPLLDDDETNEPTTSSPTVLTTTDDEGVELEEEDGNNNTTTIIVVCVVFGALGLIGVLCCCFDRIECCGYQIECCFYDEDSDDVETGGGADENGLENGAFPTKPNKDEEGAGADQSISTRAVAGDEGVDSSKTSSGKTQDTNPSSETNGASSNSSSPEQATESNDSDGGKKNQVQSSSLPLDEEDDSVSDDKKQEEMMTNVVTNDEGLLVQTSEPVILTMASGRIDSTPRGSEDIHVFEDDDNDQEQKEKEVAESSPLSSSTESSSTFDERFNPHPLPAEARAIHPLPASFPPIPYGYPSGTLPAYATTSSSSNQNQREEDDSSSKGLRQSNQTMTEDATVPYVHRVHDDFIDQEDTNTLQLQPALHEVSFSSSSNPNLVHAV